MYSEPFYITEAFGNNAFSYNKRPGKKLYVPSLTKINNLDDIRFGDKIVFEDYDFNGNLQSCCGLENFYEIDYLIDPESSSGGQKKKIYLVDNHNHVYFFWHKSRFDGIIGNNSTLYHIDEHTDLRDPGIYLEPEELKDLKRIFEYTNYVDVGNYIIPAIHDGLIKEMHQIRSESELFVILGLDPGISSKENRFKNTKDSNILNSIDSKNASISNDEFIDSGSSQEGHPSIILNLDLDFFQPKLDYINYNLKKEVIQKLIKKADLITISTSPFFIDQNLALKVMKDLFNTKH